jgi:hypothetical protein
MPEEDHGSKFASGWEDLRLIDFKGRIWFTTCYRDSEEKFVSALGIVSVDMKSASILYRWSDRSKNLLPLATPDELFIVDIYKRKVFRVRNNVDGSDTDTDTVIQETATIQDGYALPGEIFGTSSFATLSNGTYGAMVHSTYIIGNGRYYLHYWIEIDVSKWTIVHVSDPFVMERFGIEFPMGIEVTQSNHVDLYCGIDDKSITRYTVYLDELRK